MPATDTPADEHRVEAPVPVTVSAHDDGDGDFISFSESAPLRPFSLPSTLDVDERSSFLSLTPDPALEIPQPPLVLADSNSSFLSFTDTPPASSTPDPLSETLSVVQEEEEEEGEEEEEEEQEQEEDIGAETKPEEEGRAQTKGEDDSEEIDLGDAILLESGRSENVVVEVDKDPESGDDSDYVAPTPGEQTSFYYDKELKRWVGKKPGQQE